MLYLQAMYLYSKNSLIYHTFLLPKYLLQKVEKFKNIKFQYFLQEGGTHARTQHCGQNNFLPKPRD